MTIQKRSIGLALGAGGAKGLVHIGILKVLHKHKIYPNYIAGTSIGAVIGAAYAAGFSPEELEEFAKTTDWKSIVDFTIPKNGLLQPELIEQKIRKLVHHRDFQELKVPLRIVAYNLSKNERVVFSKGNVARAVRASLSIPGVFPPLKMNNDFYIDGAVTDPTPFDIVRDMGADIVIAVDLYRKEKTVVHQRVEGKSFFEEMQEKFVMVELFNVKNYLFPQRWPRFLRRVSMWIFDKILYPAKVLRILTGKERSSITQVMYDAVGVLTNNLARERIEHADVDILVNPSFDRLGWGDFNQAAKFIKIGEIAMEKEIRKLQYKLR